MSTQDKQYGQTYGVSDPDVNFLFTPLNKVSGKADEEGLITMGYDDELKAGVMLFGHSGEAHLVSSRILDISVNEDKEVKVTYFNGYFPDSFTFKAFDEDAVRAIVELEKNGYDGVEYIEIDAAGNVSLKYADLYAKIKEDLLADGIGTGTDADMAELRTKVTAVEAGIAENNDAIAALATRMTSAEENITLNGGLIDELDTTLNAHITEAAGKFSGIEENFDEIDADIEKASADIENIKKQLPDFAKTSDLEGLAMEESVNEIKNSLGDYAKKDDIADLADMDTVNKIKDSLGDFVTKEELDNAHQDLSGYVLKEDADATYAYKTDLDSLASKDEIPSVAGLASQADLDNLATDMAAVKADIEDCVEYSDHGDGRFILLDNASSLSGQDTAGRSQNLAVVSEAGVAEFGSNAIPANINTSSDVKINGIKTVAAVEDIEEKYVDNETLADTTEQIIGDTDRKLSNLEKKLISMMSDKGGIVIKSVSDILAGE